MARLGRGTPGTVFLPARQYVVYPFLSGNAAASADSTGALTTVVRLAGSPLATAVVTGALTGTEIYLVAHTGVAGATTTGSPIDTTGATLLVVHIAQLSDVALGTVSDSQGNTWTPLTTHAVSSSVTSTLFYAEHPTVGTGHTVTYTPVTTDYPAICFAAFARVLPASPFDQEAGGSSATITLAPGSVTPSQNGELVLSGLGVRIIPGHTDPGSTIDAGFTITDQVLYVPFVNYGVGLAYLVQTTATAANPTWSNAEAAALAGSNATFKAAVAAALAGTPVATATAAGALTASIVLSGAALASATSAGALTAVVTLAGSAAASAVVTGTLAVTVTTLAGTITAGATSTGTLTASIMLAGTATAAGQASAALTATITLACAAIATAALTGALTALKPGLGPILRTYTIPQTPVAAAWPRTHTTTEPRSRRQTADLVTIDG